MKLVSHLPNSVGEGRNIRKQRGWMYVVVPSFSVVPLRHAIVLAPVPSSSTPDMNIPSPFRNSPFLINLLHLHRKLSYTLSYFIASGISWVSAFLAREWGAARTCRLKYPVSIITDSFSIAPGRKTGQQHKNTAHSTHRLDRSLYVLELCLGESLSCGN